MSTSGAAGKFVHERCSSAWRDAGILTLTAARAQRVIIGSPSSPGSDDLPSPTVDASANDLALGLGARYVRGRRLCRAAIAMALAISAAWRSVAGSQGGGRPVLVTGRD